MTAPSAGPFGAKFCVTCGAARDPHSRFCTGCGATVSPAEDGPYPQDPPTQGPSAAPSWNDPSWDTAHPAEAAWPEGGVTAAHSPPVRSVADAPWEPASPHGPGRRRRTPLILLAVVLAAAAGGGYLLTRPDSTPSSASPSARAPAPAPKLSGGATAPTPTSSTDSTTSTGTALPPPTGTSQNLASSLSISVPSQAKDGQDGAGNPTSYPAGNMTDSDPTTCWRMNGDAAGQQLTINVPAGTRITSVGLINGYAKVDPNTGDDRYRQERRITHVTWQFLDGSSVDQTLDPANRSVQSVPVPGAPQASQVGLRIDATSPGDIGGFDYTAISTIDIEGQ